MSSNMPIKVMIVDDHPIVRDGLQAALERSADFEVVGQAQDGVEALRAAQELEPDVVIMDVIMPHKDGVEACRDIMDLLPHTRVLMLTASTEEDAVIEAVAAGATGYLQKHSGSEELLTAVREVAANQLRIPGDTLRRVIAAIRKEPDPTGRPDARKLTPREREVLRLFASGNSYARIAGAKGNSPITIRNTVYRIQAKLGVTTKQEIVVWAVRNGLLDGDGAEKLMPSPAVGSDVPAPTSRKGGPPASGSKKIT